MPTDIDSLQIGISATSKKAEDSIDKLVTSLTKLKTALSLGTNISNFEKAMKDISSNMDNVSTSISSIDTDSLTTVTKNFKALSKSIIKLASASEKINFSNASSSANSFINVAKQGAADVAKQFGITDAKAIESLEKSFISLAKAVNSNNGNGVKTFANEIAQQVSESKRVIKAFPDEYRSIVQSIQNANKNMKIHLPFSGSEFTDDYTNMRKTLGKAFTSSDASGVGLDKFIGGFNPQELQALNSVIVSMGGNVDNVADQFAALVRIKNEFNAVSNGGVEESENTTLQALQNSVSSSVGAFQNLTNALGQVNINQGQTVNLFQQLSNSLNAFSGLSLPDMSNLSTLADSITKFGYKSASQGVQSISGLTHVLPQLVTSMNGLGSVSFQAESLSNLALAIAKLGGKGVTNAALNIPFLTGSLKTLINEMNQLQAVSFNTESLSNLATSISKLGSAASGRAVTNIPKITQEVMNMMRTLRNAPTVSQNLIDMATAMGNLGGSARSLTSGSTTNGFKRLFDTIRNGSNKASGGMKSLAYYFGKFYANFWLLRRGFGLIKGSIDYASDLVEVQNVVDNSFGKLTGKVNDFAKSAISSFGMSELTAKKVSSRFQAMGVAMGITNAQVEASNKTWTTHSDELDKIGQNYNNTAKSMADLSINLTKLAADLGSFYNVEYDQVAESLQSVFTGQTRPLRAYGLDLTQATLKEWAFTQGIEANFKTMTQSEKTMLRYQYVMAHTGNIQGDFIRTSASWANITRMLTQNLQNLGATIGGIAINAFRPFLASLNSVILKLNEFAIAVANSLGKIFGWKYDAGTGGSLADVAEDADGVSSGLGEAANNAKKLKNQLQGFDQLNVLTSDKDNGSGSGGGSGATSGASGSDGQWTKTQSMLKEYESELNTLEKLGNAISQKLTNALNGIDWNKVYRSARNFGKGLANFLNGLIKPNLFKALGRTIANGINTALEFLNSFGTTFNWKNFGNSLAQGINSFMRNINWKTALNASSAWGKGIADALNKFIKETDFKLLGQTVAKFIKTAVNGWYKFVTTFDFSQLGDKIGDSINGFITEMNQVDYTGLNGWQKLGKTISGIVDGITDLFVSAIKKIKFVDILKAAMDFTGSLSFNTLTIGFGALAWKLGAKKLTKALLETKIGTLLGKKISVGGSLTLMITAAVVGFAVGNWLYNNVDWVHNWSEEMGKWIFGRDFKNSKLEVTLKTLTIGVSALVVSGIIAKIIGGITEGLVAKMVGKKIGDTVLSDVGSSKASGVFKSVGSTISEKILPGLKGLGSKIGTTLTTDLGDLAASTSLAGKAALVGGTIFAAITAAFEGFEFGKWLGKKLFPEDAEYYDNFKWSDFLGLNYDDIVGAFTEMGNDARKSFYLGFNSPTTYHNTQGDSFGGGGGKFEINVDGKITNVKDGRTNEQKNTDKIDLNAAVKDAFIDKSKTYGNVNVTGDVKNAFIDKKKTYGNLNVYADITKMNDKLKSHTLSGFKVSINDATVTKSAQDMIKNSMTFKATLTPKQIASGKSLLELAWKKNGGIFKNGMWHDIPQYAAGTPNLGIPNMGTLFWAGEAGAEIVGNTKNGTEVLNQSQIAQSISLGVQEANAQQNNLIAQQNALLQRQNELLVGIYEKSGISSNDIFESVRRSDRAYAKQNGHTAFGY